MDTAVAMAAPQQHTFHTQLQFQLVFMPTAVANDHHNEGKNSTGTAGPAADGPGGGHGAPECASYVMNPEQSESESDMDNESTLTDLSSGSSTPIYDADSDLDFSDECSTLNSSRKSNQPTVSENGIRDKMPDASNVFGAKTNNGMSCVFAVRCSGSYPSSCGTSGCGSVKPHIIITDTGQQGCVDLVPVSFGPGGVCSEPSCPPAMAEINHLEKVLTEPQCHPHPGSPWSQSCSQSKSPSVRLRESPMLEDFHTRRCSHSDCVHNLRPRSMPAMNVTYPEPNNNISLSTSGSGHRCSHFGRLTQTTCSGNQLIVPRQKSLYVHTLRITDLSVVSALIMHKMSVIVI